MITAQFRQKVVKKFKICYFTATFFEFPQKFIGQENLYKLYIHSSLSGN